MENKDGQRCHDKNLAIKVSTMSKITLASSSEAWLINLPGDPFVNHFLSNDMEGLGLTGSKGVFQESLARETDATTSMKNHYAENSKNECCGDPGTTDEFDSKAETLEAFPVTRSKVRADTTITTPAANSIISGDRTTSEHEKRTITQELENHKIRWKNVPKQPIPALLSDVSLWAGHQHKRMPKEYRNLPPDGKPISSIKGHPEGLLAIPNEDGSPRIIVPRSQILALVLQTHEDIYHQSHLKVLYILKPLFYWPGMMGDVENIHMHSVSNLHNSANKTTAPKGEVRSKCPNVHDATKARLRHRFLRRLQWRNHGHSGLIYKGNHVHAFKPKNTRQCSADDI